jgi:glutamate--cysteine ligase
VKARVGERIRHSVLLDEVRGALAASGRGERTLRVGLEVEAILVGADGTRLPLNDPDEDGLSSRAVVAAAARAEGWRVAEPGVDPPVFQLPDGASVTFEPGGQVEVRTRPMHAPASALRIAREAWRVLHREAAARGAALVWRGMDPVHGDAGVGLSIDSPRYVRQLRHYDTVGPWGRRMMLMSAAIHLNLDLGGRPVRRWAAANRMAPYLTALFADSPRYAGGDTGTRSFRAEQWRHLDPSRTGVFSGDGDPAREYLAFALRARDFMGGPDDGPSPPFRARWEAGAGLEAWRTHLTTLFPEVRPRRYLEIRSIDALRPAWLGVPTLLLTGVLYDADALEEALDLLPPADPERLLRAGRVGLGDPELAETGLQLLDLGLEGAARLGEGRDLAEEVEVARTFRDRFTARRLDPGHEEVPEDPFEV